MRINDVIGVFSDMSVIGVSGISLNLVLLHRHCICCTTSSRPCVSFIGIWTETRTASHADC